MKIVYTFKFLLSLRWVLGYFFYFLDENLSHFQILKLFDQSTAKLQ